jgi:hypothetical protein
MTTRSSLRAATGSALGMVALMAGAVSSGGPSAAAQPPASSPRVRQAVSSGQGIGDPYYPADGNRGYNVVSYHVRLNYFRPSRRIAAVTTVRMIAMTRLNRFHLDRPEGARSHRQRSSGDVHPQSDP